MDTKRAILEKSIELFNKYGYASVTMRDIANALNKSVGNITYHYKKKSDIIIGITKLQYEEYSEYEHKTEIDLHSFNAHLHLMLNHQKRFLFYFKHFTELRNSYNEIFDMQMRVKSELFNYFTKVFECFVNVKLFKPSVNKDYYRYLSEGIVLIMMSWAQQSALQKDDIHKGLLDIVWSILYLNLTDYGLTLYKQML